MRTASCEACGKTVPLNDSAVVVGHTMCHPCARTLIDERAAAGTPLTGNDVSGNVDPTICGWCKSDAADAHPARIADVPTCEACDTRMRNFPLPRWVKVGFAVLLIAAIVSFAMNARFLFGFLAMKRAARQMDQQQFALAADSMEAAAAHVPEAKGFAAQAALLHGIVFMQADDARSAVPWLQKAVALDPASVQLQRMLLDAESGAAFDDKRFDVFLDKSREFERLAPDDPMAKLRVASALACLYASSGDKSAQEKALATLAEVKNTAPANDPLVADYEDRIRFRLETREVLSSLEFQKRFPNGWKRHEALAVPAAPPEGAEP